MAYEYFTDPDLASPMGDIFHAGSREQALSLVGELPLWMQPFCRALTGQMWPETDLNQPTIAELQAELVEPQC